MRKKEGSLLVIVTRFLPLIFIIGVAYYVLGDKITFSKTSDYVVSDESIGQFKFIENASANGLSSDEDFRAKGNRSVVLFTSTWCGSCDYLVELIKEQSGQPEYSEMKFYQIDIDQNWELANKLGVTIAPSAVYIDDIDFATRREIKPSNIKGESSDLVFFLPGGVFNLDFYQRGSAN